MGFFESGQTNKNAFSLAYWNGHMQWMDGSDVRNFYFNDISGFSL